MYENKCLHDIKKMNAKLKIEWENIGPENISSTLAHLCMTHLKCLYQINYMMQVASGNLL